MSEYLFVYGTLRRGQPLAPHLEPPSSEAPRAPGERGQAQDVVPVQVGEDDPGHRRGVDPGLHETAHRAVAAVDEHVLAADRQERRGLRPVGVRTR